MRSRDELAEEIALAAISTGSVTDVPRCFDDAYKYADLLIARRVLAPAVEAGGSAPAPVAAPASEATAEDLARTIRCANRDGHFADARLFDLLDAELAKRPAPAATVDEARERVAFDKWRASIGWRYSDASGVGFWVWLARAKGGGA